MEKVLESRVRRLVAKPLEFWPFQLGLAPDERAVRASRAMLYIGLAYAYQERSWKAAAWPLGASAIVLLLFGRPTKIRLDDQSLASNPNPAGNAPVGDLSGRDADAPLAPASISMTDFVSRMQEPIRTDDYSIIPVAAPNQAHQIYGDTTPTSDITASRRPIPIPARG